jgi:hypothetical protein
MGKYKNFDACVKAMAKKASDPHAYCGAIKHKVEGKGRGSANGSEPIEHKRKRK